jgi:hypothetical protein
MQAITTIGLDIAKSGFQVHGIDAQGNVVLRRQLKRRYVLVNLGISRITFSWSTAFKSSPLKNSITPFVLSAAVRYGKSVPYTICDIGMSCAIAASVTLLAT